MSASSLSAAAQNRTTVEERPAITFPLTVPGIEVVRRDRIERREVDISRPRCKAAESQRLFRRRQETENCAGLRGGAGRTRICKQLAAPADFRRQRPPCPASPAAKPRKVKDYSDGARKPE